MVTPKLSVWSVTCTWERPTLATMQATTRERILFLCIESSSQNGNWTLPLLGNWENQPRCKLYRWISHAKSVVAKPKDQHSRSVGIRIGIACVSEGHFRMTYFFLFCFHVCRLVLPNLGSVLSHQPFLQPGSLGHHLPFVFLHVVLRSHQSGSSWRRAKCYLTHTLDSLALTTLEARHPQAVYDLNSDLPCVRETRQLYSCLNEATLLCD